MSTTGEAGAAVLLLQESFWQKLQHTCRRGASSKEQAVSITAGQSEAAPPGNMMTVSCMAGHANRGASCPPEQLPWGSNNPVCDYDNFNAATSNPNTLFGAMVGGGPPHDWVGPAQTLHAPDQQYCKALHGACHRDIISLISNHAGPGNDDSYSDVRSDYEKNEVAVDYNSGWTGVPPSNILKGTCSMLRATCCAAACRGTTCRAHSSDMCGRNREGPGADHVPAAQVCWRT